MDSETMETPGGFVRAIGTEARMCRDIAGRQHLGLSKYGVTVENNPLTLRQWLQHQYQELLDAAIYCRRSIEELDRNTDDGK